MGFPNAIEITTKRLSLNKREKIALSKLIRPPSESLRNSLKVAPLTCASGRDLGIDGFNVLITVESALQGNPIYVCSDGLVRDLSLAYSSYKPSDKFEEVIRMIGDLLDEIRPKSVTIYLDAPISKSGRMALRIRNILRDVRVVTSKHVDSDLLRHEVVASSDSLIISKAECIVDLPREILRRANISPIPLFPFNGLIEGLMLDRSSEDC